MTVDDGERSELRLELDSERNSESNSKRDLELPSTETLVGVLPLSLSDARRDRPRFEISDDNKMMRLMEQRGTIEDTIRRVLEHENNC